MTSTTLQDVEAGMRLPDDRFRCLRPRHQPLDEPPVELERDTLDRYLRPVTIAVDTALRPRLAEHWISETCRALDEGPLYTLEDFRDAERVIGRVSPELALIETAQTLTLQAAVFVDFVLDDFDRLAENVKHLTWPPNPDWALKDHERDDVGEVIADIDILARLANLLRDVEDALAASDRDERIARAA